MPQPKGKTGNPNGRPKGRPNKITASTKVWIQQIVDNNRNQLEADLKNLDPVQRWQIVEKLLSYLVPKQQATASTVEFSKMDERELDQIINELTEKTK